MKCLNIPLEAIRSNTDDDEVISLEQINKELEFCQKAMDLLDISKQSLRECNIFSDIISSIAQDSFLFQIREDSEYE